MLLLPLAVYSQENLSFKGLELGAPRDAVLATLGDIRCSGTRCSALPQRTCTNTDPGSECFKRLSYGGALPIFLGVEFRDDRLVSVYLTFPERRFDELRDALIERFGPPTHQEASTVQNRMGASFEARQAEWKKGDANLQLKQRGSKIDEGSLFLVSIQYTHRSAEERKQKAKDTAKDM